LRALRIETKCHNLDCGTVRNHVCVSQLKEQDGTPLCVPLVTDDTMTRKLVLPSSTKRISGMSTADKLHFGDFSDNGVSSDPSEER